MSITNFPAQTLRVQSGYSSWSRNSLLLWNSKVHCHVQKSQSLEPIRSSWIQSRYLYLFSKMHSYVPTYAFVFQIVLYWFLLRSSFVCLISLCVLHVPPISFSLMYMTQLMKTFILKFSSVLYCFTYLRLKRLPQNFAVRRQGINMENQLRS